MQLQVQSDPDLWALRTYERINRNFKMPTSSNLKSLKRTFLTLRWLRPKTKRTLSQLFNRISVCRIAKNSRTTKNLWRSGRKKVDKIGKRIKIKGLKILLRWNTSKTEKSSFIRRNLVVNWSMRLVRCVTVLASLIKTFKNLESIKILT